MTTLQGSPNRTILASNAELALATFLDGEKEAIDARCEHIFDIDPDDRPVPYQISTFGAALLSADTTQLLGRMSWRAVPFGPTLSSTTWNLGIHLLPTSYGRGLSAQAGRLLARYLFDTTGVDRVQALTDIANVPGWRGLERAGFHRDGVLRGCVQRGGERRDMALYSLLRSDLTEA